LSYDEKEQKIADASSINSLSTTFNTDDTLFDIPEQNEIITDISPIDAADEKTNTFNETTTDTVNKKTDTFNETITTSTVEVNNADTDVNALANNDVNDHPVVIMAKINQQ
jgi:carbohydrate-binding DOMON domain-containing protein